MNSRRTPLLVRLLMFAAAGLAGSAADAHFVYVVSPAPGESTVRVTFGESAEAGGDEAMLPYLEGIELSATTAGSIALAAVDGSLEGDGSDLAVYQTDRTFGVLSRGGETFLLKYFAVAGPGVDQWSWRSRDSQAFEVLPESENGQLFVVVHYDGERVPNAEVTYRLPGGEPKTGTTGSDGRLAINDPSAGLVDIRAKHVLPGSGEYQGKAFESTKLYATLTFRVNEDTNVDELTVLGGPSGLSDMPETLTSFGATRLGDSLFVYGGHTSDAHSYSRDEQSNVLWSLDLSSESQRWVERATGEPLQGNALVAADDRVWLLGGFTALNAEGEDQNLSSQATVRVFERGSDQWSFGPSLPEPRSSFDAIVENGVIYVAGGWSMQGEAETVWHQTAWKLDTNATDLKWEPLATPPFERRALALAAHGGKVFAIGGMSRDAGPTTSVDVYDPELDAWVRGSSLVGESMNGFGCAACVVDGQLLVTAYDGSIQRLSVDGKTWDVIGKLPAKRFFHRLVPAALDDADGVTRVLVLGGADMEVGKFSGIDAFVVPSHK